MIESHPLLLAIIRNQNQKIFLHPTALLAAMLASAYFLSNEKDSTSGNSSLDDAKNASINSLAQQFGILAAASLAAIWIEHQADSVFKLLESTLVFQANTPSDVAETAHDFASLDIAIMQAVRDVESGVHRIDLSNSNLVAPQDGNDHENVATAPNGPNGNNAHSDPIPNDSDSAVASGNPQPVIPAKDVAPSMLIASQLTPSPLIASQLTPSPQPSSSLGTIVETSEAAVQLADTDTLSASSQPVVPWHAVSPTVKAFLQHTLTYEITVSGSNVKIVDTHLSDAASPNFGVLTWDLSNGSTLSIVGIIPHHRHATSGAA
jgi:hypothetical protein